MGELKLTKAQEAVVSRLKRGDVLLFSTGPSGSVTWKDTTERAVNPATIHALYKAGLTKQERYGHTLSVGLYQIVLTEKGQAYFATIGTDERAKS